MPHESPVTSTRMEAISFDILSEIYLILYQGQHKKEIQRCMYNVHDHNENTLTAMRFRHSLAFVTLSDTQEASYHHKVSLSIIISPDTDTDRAII